MLRRMAAFSSIRKLFVDFGDLRGHQVRLQGGDASSDFYCYP